MKNKNKKPGKLSKNKIKPIVINAFYHKDGKEMVDRLKKIKKLRAISVLKVNPRA